MFFKWRCPLSLAVIPGILFIMMMASCSTATSPVDSVTPVQPTEIASSVPTAVITRENTATSIPLALEINGMGVSLEEYELQKAQLKKAAELTEKTISDEEIVEMVLGYFIDSELMAQAARQEGYLLESGEITARMEALIQEAGGSEQFQSWLGENGYSEVVFQSIYKRELEAAWKRDSIIQSVGDTAEQINARQIFVFDSALADQILRQLKGGSDFATLAADYDPLTRGDLGWFPRGYLFLPEVEEAVFALQPGQFTEVIHSSHGYHIVQVVEREKDHPLSADARQALIHQAVNRWLEEQRGQSSIEVLVP